MLGGALSGLATGTLLGIPGRGGSIIAVPDHDLPAGDAI
jgi:hypothetical protein